MMVKGCCTVEAGGKGHISISSVSALSYHPLFPSFLFCPFSFSLWETTKNDHVSLTHCRLNRPTHTIYWKSPISILGTSIYEIYIFLEKNG